MAKPSKPRNYAKATQYEERPRQVKRREARNRARYQAAKKAGKGNVKAGRTKLRGKEVDHKRMNPAGLLSNTPSNLRVVSQHTNRVKQPKRKGYKP